MRDECSPVLQHGKEDTPQQMVNRTIELENINRAQSQEIGKQGQEINAQKAIAAELKKSLRREKLTKHLIQRMNRSFEPQIILEIIVQELGTFFNVDRCLIILYEKENETDKMLQLFAQYCSSDAISPIGEEEIPNAWKELLPDSPKKEQASIVLNASESKQCLSMSRPVPEKYPVQSAFITEIKYRGVAFGRLVLHQCRVPGTWTENDINFLEVLATHIGAALYQIKLYQQERQAKQEAEKANQQKSKILAFVSHDFKNPLASMKRFIEILENDKSDILSEKHRELIGYISEGVYQLHSLVIDILDKARLAEGKITPMPVWFELHSFIDDLKPMFSAMAAPRNIEVSIDIQADLSAIKADPTHVRQILINLVSNAVKYNRINGKVSVSFYKLETEQSVVIEVQDTGLGIAKEKIPQLFTEYFRSDLSQANQVEGTGLGLAFIKKLIELHGGTISVESELGTGSTFRVLLPLLPAVDR